MKVNLRRRKAICFYHEESRALVGEGPSLNGTSTLKPQEQGNSISTSSSPRAIANREIYYDAIFRQQVELFVRLNSHGVGMHVVGLRASSPTGSVGEPDGHCIESDTRQIIELNGFQDH